MPPRRPENRQKELAPWPSSDSTSSWSGAGPAGEVAAGRLAEGGLRVAIVEEHLVGGECSFYACMPSKALLRPDEALAEARRVPGRARGRDRRARRRRRARAARRGRSTTSTTSVQVPWLEDRGVTLVRGEGVLDGERRVRVGDDVLVADRAVVLATGSDAALPPIDGLAEARPWTNREATTRRTRPARLLVLGAGPVGVELAQAWATLGSEVVAARGRPPHPPARGAVRVRRGAGRARRARRRRLLRRRGHARRARGRSRARGPRVGRDAGGRRAARRRRPPAADGGHRPGERRPRGRRAGRRRRPPARPRAPVALRDRRLQRPRAARPTRASTRPASRPTTSSATRRRACTDEDGRLAPRVVFTEPQVAAVGHTQATAQEAGIRVLDRRLRRRTRRPAASFIGTGVPAHARLVDRRGPARHRRRDVHRRGGRADCCTPRRSPSSERSRSRGCAHAVPSLPDAQRGVARAAGRPWRL